MPKPLVECIPNFSEARKPEVVDQIVAAITSVNGVHLLDRHSDLDHNRTVITIIGEPQAVEEAAFLAIKKAAELIDLNIHTGAHPRIGATDVVPFVPISEITMAECVEIAKRLGKRVGEELSIPVYLYEDAASRPDRQNLENIRKGQYEGLREEIKTNPDRKPDFGPGVLGSAGATVIGARAPLIALNVYLTTNEITIAQKIAKAVRNSSGGLRFIKGMGVLVEGRAQVSMNFTNFRQTPIARTVELIRREAARYGVGIHHSELVGLIPQEALLDAAVWYTQLDDFKPDQILENRLFEVVQPSRVTEKPGFLDELASDSPTPGGGSAAAYTGAEAAALVAMVARVTVGKKKYANVEPQMLQLIDKAEELRARLTAAVKEDSEAFEQFMKAIKLPKETEKEIAARSAALLTAAKNAAEVPLKSAGLCLNVMGLALTAASLGNINAISDAVSASHLANAALESAVLNVKINIKSLENPEEMKEMIEASESMINSAAEFKKKIRIALTDRANIT